MENTQIRTYLYKNKARKFYQMKVYDRLTKKTKILSTGATNEIDANAFKRQYRERYIDGEKNIERFITAEDKIDHLGTLPTKNKKVNRPIEDLMEVYINVYRRNKLMISEQDEKKKKDAARCDRNNVNLLLEYFGNKGIRDINDDQLGKFIGYCKKHREKETNGHRKNLANASICLALTVLCSALNNCYEGKDADKLIKTVRFYVNQLRKASPVRDIVMSEALADQMQKWYDKNTKYLKTMFRMLRDIGARRNEIQNLKWKDIDIQNRKAKVYDSKSHRDVQYRTVNFTKTVQKELADMKLILCDEKGQPKYSEYVFIGEVKKKPLQDRVWYEKWYKMSEDLGLMHYDEKKGKMVNTYRAHDLRRLKITTDELAGVPHSYTDNQTGHKTDLCRKRYMIHSDEKNLEYVDQIEENRKKVKAKNQDREKILLDSINEILWTGDPEKALEDLEKIKDQLTATIEDK